MTSGPVVTPDRSFDSLADEYERVRPGYPESVVDRILDFAQLTSDARLLEVGTGTAKATVAFARRGYRILALEPGPNLARIARSRLADFREVEVRTVSLEDSQLESRAFNLAFVAQAFHWLPRAERLPKLAAALRPSAVLAVFGNSVEESAGAVRDAVQEAYRRCAPSLNERSHARDWYAAPDGPILNELRSSLCFSDASHQLFSWEQELSSAEYVALVSTYSNHSTLPPAQLAELVTALSKGIDAQGGRVSLEYRTGLFLARAV